MIKKRKDKKHKKQNVKIILNEIEIKQNERKTIEMNILFYSSFIFITNMITAYSKQYYLYSLFFFFLFITSILFHSNKNIYTNFFDKIAISLIVFYGSYQLYTKVNHENYLFLIMIVSLFILCIYLYTYGYYQKCYCYHEEICIGNLYHCILHLISSLGHHLIIFM